MKKLLIAILLLLSPALIVKSHATACTLPYANELTGGYIYASHWNANAAAIMSCLNNQTLDGTTNIAVGGIQTANIANSAITDAKIYGITTAGKVNGSAITAINNLPSGAGQVPVANLGTGSPTAYTVLLGNGTWGAANAYIKITNTQSSGTAGGSLTGSTSAWQTLLFNTKDNDTQSLGTLSSNTISLPSGTYEVHASTPVFNTGENLEAQIRLYNNTASSTLINGQNCSGLLNDQTYSSCTASLDGMFTLSSTSTVVFQIWSDLISSTGNLGNALSTGTSEVYATAVFTKIS